MLGIGLKRQNTFKSINLPLIYYLSLPNSFSDAYHCSAIHSPQILKSPKMVKRSKNKPPGRRRHFFKVMFPGRYARKLQIPPDFVEHISKEAYKSATLEDSSGNHWRTRLSKTTDGTYLGDGWPDFVKDHSIYDFNFLVFGYDGNTCFNVLIFYENACERDYVFKIKTNEGSAFSNGRDKSSETPDSVQKASKDDPGQCLLTFKPKELEKPKREDVELTSEQLSRTRFSLSRRRPATKKEKAKVRKEAESFTSKFPCFLKCLTTSNVHRLIIPVKFARTNRRHLRTQWKTETTLWNAKGEAWTVNLIYSWGRTALCGGWLEFLRANKLEEADICIFELVEQQPSTPKSEKVLLLMVRRESSSTFGLKTTSSVFTLDTGEGVDHMVKAVSGDLVQEELECLVENTSSKLKPEELSKPN
ncbi:hypothetical protein NE237_024389 [Protea cynaroides]|uniref:TF-B3 domain-containing protein n=1 Tax=Protea cynaroides TaxID=273540 RepID=A0A9Q0HGV0_9MAGN|nr:hypothetical protein NE237_024389 [Protea cynaroides]